MKVAIHLSKEEEARALPILLRHSSGMILPDGIYVLSLDALKALRKAGVRFSEVSREATARSGGGRWRKRMICSYLFTLTMERQSTRGNCNSYKAAADSICMINTRS